MLVNVIRMFSLKHDIVQLQLQQQQLQLQQLQLQQQQLQQLRLQQLQLQQTASTCCIVRSCPFCVVVSRTFSLKHDN